MSTKKQPAEPEFKGYDFTELLDHFGVEYDDKTEADDLSKLRAFLESHMQNAPDVTPQAVAVCREFLKAVTEQEKRYGYRGPLFQGRLDVTNDYTFMREFINMLPGLWT